MHAQTSNPNPLPGSLGTLVPALAHQRGGARANFYLPVRDLLAVQVVGHIDLELGTAIRDFNEAQFAKGVVLRIFHDWEGVTGYDSEARTFLTRWTVDRRAHFRSVTFLTKSRLVAMGVATANLATSLVGLSMRSTTERAEYERALLEAVRS